MSSLIIVVLVLNLLHILFSTVSVRSDQSVLPIRSFKVRENATYDCVDINNQPGLGHRLLQNHTIQMKPSVSIHELRNHIDNNKSYSSEIGCPDGTVPILRISNEYNTKAQLFSEKYFHPLTVDNPGAHIVGIRSSTGPYRGVEASYNGYTQYIEKDQASYSEIYIGSWLNNQVNYIQAGYIINPSFFGTGQLWTYGYFKGKDGKGCYNTACDGFIQVSRKIPIVQPININPGDSDWSRWSIHQDKATGNWWLTQLIENAPNVDIGYWPKELFNILNNGANIVGVGGVVQASHNGSSPPMGNGNFPVGSHKNSAMFTNIEVLDYNYISHKMNYFPTEILVDSPQCYDIRIGKVKLFHSKRLGFFFNYGGPGGKFCGV
ncbi:PREDICTED: uncharacterized protein LOC104763020 [Camelina sativa]|uniref:Uncharacterized protein LOC104763020 n=1 Tax=Camelina sativa TaxID=90675 RepID=A0ABM1RA16_CAMSA|nr:PREDICTED: uncharacterized protein LOC104763020 [Camelina sativa]